MIELGWRFSGVLGHQGGTCRKCGRYRWEHRHGWSSAFLRQDELGCGCLCCRRRVATQKHSEQRNERLVHHVISLLLSPYSSSRKRRNSLRSPPNPSRYRRKIRGRTSPSEERNFCECNKYIKVGVRRSVPNRTQLELSRFDPVGARYIVPSPRFSNFQFRFSSFCFLVSSFLIRVDQCTWATSSFMEKISLKSGSYGKM